MKKLVNWLREKDRYIWIVYATLALAVLLPLLLPGFVLTLDMVFVPHPPLPSDDTASYPFHGALHYFSFIIPVDLLQKIMLVAILVLSGAGAHRLARFAGVDKWAAYFAGALYMINPFVYARFMAGQYAVLLGYALLPFFVLALLKFYRRPSAKTALVVAAWAFIATMLSIHIIGLMIVVGVVSLGAALWRYRRHAAHIKKIFQFSALSVGGYLLVNSYWLIPLLLGTNSTATAIGAFDETHRQAFATEGGSALGAMGNIIRLQGFWAEGQTLFLLPQDIMPAWGLIALILIVLVAIGGVAAFRRSRFIAVIFGFSALLAGFLAIGTTYGWVGVINLWLTQHIPFFAGYREPHKFVGLVALCYAVLGAFGAHFILNKWKPAALPVLLVPLALTPLMFWGFAGQLKASQYPAEWYAMNERLNADASGGNVLFLPWHHYMSYSFAGRVIADPANKFFDKPMIVSDNPEFGGITPDVADFTKRAIEQTILVDAQHRQDLGARLARHNIAYVLLAKEYDYENYRYLDGQIDLLPITEGETLKLYRNEAYKK